MSLIAKFTTPQGDTLEDAYHKLTHTELCAVVDGVGTMQAIVETYRDAEHSKSGAEPYARRQFGLAKFDARQALNDRAATYAALKALPEFAGAVDA